MTSMSLSRISEIILKSKPKPLAFPIPSFADHADYMIKVALDGHSKLAADHILHPEMNRMLEEVIGSLVRRIGFLFTDLDKDTGEFNSNDPVVLKSRIYDMLLEMVWNLVGIEPRWASIPEEVSDKALKMIFEFLKECEYVESKKIGAPLILKGTIMIQLEKAMLVNKGNSMVAWMAKEINSRIKEDNIVESYINAIREVINKNFYFNAYKKGMCKFGNDYALGLRWLRHLGYVQVSTNPVLASIAYDDDPSLWEAFKEYFRENIANIHPEWFKEPEKYADDIAMEATLFVLLDNFYVFRVPFLLSRGHDGLVSYQLNPLIADNVEKSVEAAREFAKRLENILKVYDSYLLWGYNWSAEKGRPNLVIKVAAAYPSSIEIAKRLNEIGIGQNITLSYTVTQELLTGIAAMEGMSKAIKKGILPTQTYLTNMGGRLEDHLKEYVAANLLIKALNKLDVKKAEEIIDMLALGLNAKSEVFKELKTLEERVEILTDRKILGGNLLNNAYVEALVSSKAYGGKQEVIEMLNSLNEAIKLAGTFIAKRVYEIMFSSQNRPKWIDYISKEFGISRKEAETIIDRIDLLPASKRKPADTLLTLSSRNLTNTEFPNHQLDVVKESMKNGFKIESFKESISWSLDEKYLKILMNVDDFVKAYEITPRLKEFLEKLGISGDYGTKGVEVVDWPNYGPCFKTLKEFTQVYLNFRKRILDILKD
ncbi:MAG: transaldolase family protein [Nitrososphaerota archaeon]|nr:transaldolase family protein [Nitrososphaerota archaeon]